MREHTTRSFGCREAILHFLYTFTFTPMPGIEDTLRCSNSRKRLAGTLRRSSRRVFADVALHWGSREMEQRGWNDMLDPFLYFRHPHIEARLHPRTLSVQPVHNRLSPFEPRRCRANGRILVFPSGFGILDYRIAVSRSRSASDGLLGVQEIVDLLTLGFRYSGSSRKSNQTSCQLRLTERHKEVFLHQIFSSCVQGCKSMLNSCSRESHPIEWIEVDNGLVGDWNGVAERTHTAVTRFFELPYPIFVGEMPGDQYNLLFPPWRVSPEREELATRPSGVESSDLQQAMMRDLLTVLFRSREWHNPDRGFAAKKLDFSVDGVTNMCSIRTWFTRLFHRTCIVLSPDLGIDSRTGRISKSPGVYLEDALIETVSYLRMMWHVFTVTNARLDPLLSRLYDQMVRADEPLSNANPDNEELVATLMSELRQKQRELIRAKADAIRALQDPITCRLGSQTMSNVFDHGIECFRIGELRRATLEKMEHLSRLFEEVSAYLRWNESERIRAAWRSVRSQRGKRP